MSWEYEEQQKEGIVKELLLIEDHLTRFPCKHCLFKHALTVEALAEESSKMTNVHREQIMFVNLANEMRKFRKALGQDLEEFSMHKGHSHQRVVKKCSGSRCR